MFSGDETIAAIKPAAFGGRPGIDELNAIGGGGDVLEVALQRRPVGELAVGAHPEAERRPPEL